MENETRKAKLLKAQLREEGRQQRKEDEEAEKRKRKREHEKAWEESRDSRLESWKQFKDGGGGAKKKKKVKPMG